MRPAPRIDDLPHHRCDVVGDVHGCAAELHELLERAGWSEAGEGYAHPDDRLLVLLGDLTDGGPDPVAVLRLALAMLGAGTAAWAMGNHDWKLGRALKGNPVTVGRGLDTTLDALDREPATFRGAVRDAILALPHQIRVPMPEGHPRRGDGWLTCVHAAAPKGVLDAVTREAFERSIYGFPTDDDPRERPLPGPARADWAASYDGPRWIVHGHEVYFRARALNRVVAIDQGCVVGGRLTMYRTDDASLLDVPARRDYTGRGRLAG